MYSRDADLGKKYMGAVGGTREWLARGKVAPQVPYFTLEVSDIVHIFDGVAYSK